MTPFTEFVLNTGIFFGKFKLRNEIVFQPNFTHREYKKFGDVIYFMVYKRKRILKIGKTVNFYVRQNTYCRLDPDKTSIMILRESKHYDVDEVEVYAISVSRLKARLTSAFSDITYDVMISRLKEFEAIYIKEAISLGEDLIFNTQRK